jgi:hypothetical protein
MASGPMNLGSFTLAKQGSQLTLALSSSITLKLPANYADNYDIANISEEVRTGRLWIAKSSSCRLEFEISLQECMLLKGNENFQGSMEVILGLVSKCPVSALFRCQPRTTLIFPRDLGGVGTGLEISGRFRATTSSYRIMRILSFMPSHSIF